MSPVFCVCTAPSVAELEREKPEHSTVRVLSMEGRERTAVWEGEQLLCADALGGAARLPTVTRAEYLKHGHDVCRERFKDAAFEGSTMQ